MLAVSSLSSPTSLSASARHCPPAAQHLLFYSPQLSTSAAGLEPSPLCHLQLMIKQQCEEPAEDVLLKLSVRQSLSQPHRGQPQQPPDPLL